MKDCFILRALHHESITNRKGGHRLWWTSHETEKTLKRRKTTWCETKIQWESTSSWLGLFVFFDLVLGGKHWFQWFSPPRGQEKQPRGQKASESHRSSPWLRERGGIRGCRSNPQRCPGVSCFTHTYGARQQLVNDISYFDNWWIIVFQAKTSIFWWLGLL